MLHAGHFNHKLAPLGIGEDMSQLDLANPQSIGNMANVENNRAIAEVQASLLIAKTYPRDEVKAINRIMVSCQRQSLAEKACYQFARGGSNVTGPSIRLAEMMASAWGNVDAGYKIIESHETETLVEAYAWDKETNTRQVKTFMATHYREKRTGRVLLTDSRDIYEAIANQAARRVRSCILAIMPVDVVEDAVEECKRTIASKVSLTPQKIKDMVKAFSTIGVNKKMLESRIQRGIDAVEPAQFLSLLNIYNSIKDGIGTPGDYFDMTVDGETIDLGAMAKEKDPEATATPHHSDPESIPCPMEQGDMIYVTACAECPERKSCESFNAYQQK